MNLKAAWLSLDPTVREPIRSAVVSSLFALQTSALVLVGAAAADGQISSPQALTAYVAAHWWGALIGMVLPAAYRARQGYTAVTSGSPPPSNPLAH